MDRRALLASVAAAGTTTVAGCTGLLEANDTGETTSDRRSPQFSTADAADRERGRPEQVDHEHLVKLENRTDSSREVRMTVFDRRMSVQVYLVNSTYEPRFDDAIYDVADADPTGIQSYEVGIEADGRTASTVLWTNQCYGDVTLTVEGGGELTANVETC